MTQGMIELFALFGGISILACLIICIALITGIVQVEIDMHR